MRRILFFSTGIILFASCSALDQFNETLEGVEDLGDTIAKPDLGDIFGGSLKMVGVSPAPDYTQSGRVDFSLVQYAQNGLPSLGAIPDGAMRVQVKDEDGSYRDCEYDGGEPVEPLALHTLSLLIDGSGSMELSYPPSEYGDVCVTCPHDVNRDRVGASAALVRAIHTDSPESIIAIAEFGPDAPLDPDYDFRATTLHHDFATDTESVVSALDRVRGYEEHGTPLYDSVGEMISATTITADTAGDTQRSIILLSDGLDNESEQFELHDVIAFARQANVAIYTVGLGPASVRGIESDTELKNIDAILALQELARETGGFYAAADDPESLQALYDTIAVTFTDGYRRESYDCRPDPEPEPNDPCGCPSSGDPIHGRLLVGNQTIPWSSIAP